MYNQKLSQTLNILLSSNSNPLAYTEIILIYTGDISLITKQYNLTILLANYATAYIMLKDIASLVAYDEIIYITIPEPVFFSVRYGINASCPISPSIESINSLSGKGVAIALIDSGIDILHKDFIDNNGKSRILAYWDQSYNSNPPTGYSFGTLYTNEDINNLIALPNQSIPRDYSGHGTAVMGIACGNGNSSNGIYKGVAPNASIIVVKLRNTTTSTPNTAALLEGVDFCIKYALSLNLPVVVNLSYGNNYGSHDGFSIIDNYFNLVSNYGRNVIVCGTGNEASLGIHSSGYITTNTSSIVPFNISSGETLLNLELWKFYGDIVDINIILPNGQKEPIKYGLNRIQYLDTTINILYGMPSPLTTSQNIFFNFTPNNSYINNGIYSIELIGHSIKNGRFDMWLQNASTLQNQTKFLYPDENITLTTPSSARGVISVGAYNYNNNSVAFFSGRGFTRNTHFIKPDLVAPGVLITSTKVGGGYDTYTGTSFATPFVSGACALLMEWGIVNGFDPFLYSEKIKAYLIKGAKKLPSIKEYPSKSVGFGALCIKDSFPTPYIQALEQDKSF